MINTDGWALIVPTWGALTRLRWSSSGLSNRDTEGWRVFISSNTMIAHGVCNHCTNLLGLRWVHSLSISGENRRSSFSIALLQLSSKISLLVRCASISVLKFFPVPLSLTIASHHLLFCNCWSSFLHRLSSDLLTLDQMTTLGSICGKFGLGFIFRIPLLLMVFIISNILGT